MNALAWFSQNAYTPNENLANALGLRLSGGGHLGEGFVSCESKAFETSASVVKTDLNEPNSTFVAPNIEAGGKNSGDTSGGRQAVPDPSLREKFAVAVAALQQYGGEIVADAGEIVADSLFMTGDFIATELFGSTLPATAEEFAGLAEQGTEIIRRGHTGIGNELSYAQAWYLYKYAPTGFELTVDGRVVGEVLGMATPLPLDSLKVHGHVTLNAEGQLIQGLYDFEPAIMSNPNNSLQIYIRNQLNQIAIKQHGKGRPYLIKYAYDDKDFK